MINYGEVVTVKHKLAVIIGNHDEYDDIIFVTNTGEDSTEENKIKVSNMTVEEIYNIPVSGFYMCKLKSSETTIWNTALRDAEKEVYEYKYAVEEMANVEIIQEIIKCKDTPNSMKKYTLIESCKKRGFDYAENIFSFIMK